MTTPKTVAQACGRDGCSGVWPRKVLRHLAEAGAHALSRSGYVGAWPRRVLARLAEASAQPKRVFREVCSLVWATRHEVVERHPELSMAQTAAACYLRVLDYLRESSKVCISGISKDYPQACGPGQSASWRTKPPPSLWPKPARMHTSLKTRNSASVQTMLISPSSHSRTWTLLFPAVFHNLRPRASLRSSTPRDKANSEARSAVGATRS